jgi:hypothetical protein
MDPADRERRHCAASRRPGLGADLRAHLALNGAVGLTAKSEDLLGKRAGTTGDGKVLVTRQTSCLIDPPSVAWKNLLQVDGMALR